ncbi:MAG: hypothetical protein D6824_07980 [Planctomycetota bacterium]|nr:MAG: hypothetical protein D6824_07980 [Planctomycetota bacterium]
MGLESTPKLLRLNEAWMLYSKAVSVAAERLRKDALGRKDRRIEPEAREALEKALVSMLDDDSVDVRGLGWVAMLESGLAKRPDIRRRLDAMAQHDPDEQLRDNLRRNLAHYDEVEKLAATYKQLYEGSN